MAPKNSLQAVLDRQATLIAAGSAEPARPAVPQSAATLAPVSAANPAPASGRAPRTRAVTPRAMRATPVAETMLEGAGAGAGTGAGTGAGAEARATVRPSREGKRLIAGHFDPTVAKQLRLLAAEEDTTIQALLEEAISLLLVKKGKSAVKQV